VLHRCPFNPPQRQLYALVSITGNCTTLFFLWIGQSSLHIGVTSPSVGLGCGRFQWDPAGELEHELCLNIAPPGGHGFKTSGVGGIGGRTPISRHFFPLPL
jgi:hypothetical protein